MNKLMKIAGIVIVLVAAVALVGTTAVFAQGPSTPNGTPVTGQIGRGSPPAGAGGGLGVMAVDEAEMHAAIADVLGISVEEFEAALAEGETPYTLAQTLGVDFAEVRAAMDALHAEALQQAVADGLITQEQADWILSHQGGNGGGAGNMVRGNGLGRGAGGAGRGGNGGFGGYGGDCPYATS